MKRYVLYVICLLLCAVLSSQGVIYASEIQSEIPFDVDALSAVLMDAQTGTVLYAKNEDEALPPASVTKVMTLLLVMEAIDAGKLALGDQISVSEYAASMGGSQVYLEPGEQMCVDDLLKSVVVASANDAAVALAEAIAGSEEAFVKMMNARASELGMEHTCFENTTGLDDDTIGHLTSAEDIAIMSRELLKHEKILEYSTIWMDTIRDGTFGLSNTNRLIRFYSGATGLKTGSTSKAKFCISATAKRDGLHLIAVIMGSPTRDIRNEMAKRLLDWGFSNYAMYSAPGDTIDNIPLTGGVQGTVCAEYEQYHCLIEKGSQSSITSEVILKDSLCAPIYTGDCVGQVLYKIGDEIVGECPILANETVDRIGFGGVWLRLFCSFLLKP